MEKEAEEGGGVGGGRGGAKHNSSRPKGGKGEEG